MWNATTKVQAFTPKQKRARVMQGQLELPGLKAKVQRRNTTKNQKSSPTRTRRSCNRDRNDLGTIPCWTRGCFAAGSDCGLLSWTWPSALYQQRCTSAARARLERPHWRLPEAAKHEHPQHDARGQMLHRTRDFETMAETTYSNCASRLASLSSMMLSDLHHQDCWTTTRHWMSMIFVG